MARIVKDPEIRRQEILAAASQLFQTQGYKTTSVDAIIQKVGVAKGTFYYYFASKEEILAALVQQLVAEMAARSLTVADDPALTALEKLRLMMREQRAAIVYQSATIMDELHHPENRELHERSNVETILVFAPIMASVVEQGIHEGVFHVANPLETVQFLLAGAQFLLDQNLFKWNLEERIARITAMQMVIERALGAAPGSFAFLLESDPAP